MIKKSILLYFISLTSLACFGQNSNEEKFSLNNLSNTTVYIEFNYDSTKVGNESEIVYLQRVIAKKYKKKSGRGDKWLSAWQNNKIEFYESVFINGF